MNQAMEPAEVHNGLAIYRRGDGPPLLMFPYPHASGGGPIRQVGNVSDFIPTTVVTWRNCRFGHTLRSTFVCWGLGWPSLQVSASA